MGETRLIPHFSESFMLIWRRFPPISGVFLQLEAGIVDITWSIGDPDCLKDPWMAMRNESYGHPHHGKQAATMTSCRHTRCKRLLPKKLNWAAAERNETWFWVEESIRWLFPELLEVSSTLVRLEGSRRFGQPMIGRPNSFDLEGIPEVLRAARYLLEHLAEKRWVFSCGRGAFQRFVVNCLHSGPVHRNSPKMNIGGWDSHHACLPVCHCIPTPWLLISLIHHRCEQRTTRLFMLILFLLHPATLRKGSVSMHPLIFPRVIEMSINSHQCGVQHYGSFSLIHINPASQSTTEWGQNDSPLPKQGCWCPTCWLQSNLAQPRPIRQWPPWLGLGDPKWNHVAKALFFFQCVERSKALFFQCDCANPKISMLLLEDRIFLIVLELDMWF